MKRRIKIKERGGGEVLQSTLAQVNVDADTLIQETRDEVEQEIEQEAE